MAEQSEWHVKELGAHRCEQKEGKLGRAAAGTGDGDWKTHGL